MPSTPSWRCCCSTLDHEDADANCCSWPLNAAAVRSVRLVKIRLLRMLLVAGTLRESLLSVKGQRGRMISWALSTSWGSSQRPSRNLHASSSHSCHTSFMSIMTTLILCMMAGVNTLIDCPLVSSRIQRYYQHGRLPGSNPTYIPWMLNPAVRL